MSDTDSDSMPDLEEIIPQPIEVDEQYSPTTLRMTESINGELYLSIPSVFKYVTLGGKLNDENRMSLGRYILNNNNHLRLRPIVFIRKIHPITGDCKEIHIRKYEWGDYGVLAKACLGWAHENPMSVAY